MRAVVFSGPGEVALADVPRPVLIDATDAIVRVTLAGICGTDLHLIRGDLPGIAPGTVLGHEFVGEVTEVGGTVRRLRPGDPVMASDFTACGLCAWCDRGDHWHCAERAFFGSGTSFGTALPGAQAEFVRVPLADTTLALRPAECPEDVALLIGDNLATGWAAIERSRLSPGNTVAVIGGGAVGQLAALAAQAAGAGIVIVVEINAARRAFAAAHGSLAAHPDDAAALVRRTMGPMGAEIVIDAVGGDRPMQLAMQLAGPVGRVVSIGTHAADHWAFPIAHAFRAELTVGFAIGDSIRLRQRLLRLVCGGALDPAVVIDARGGLADAPALYQRLMAQDCLKAVVSP